MRVNIKSNTILSGEDVRNVIDDLARKGIYTKKIVCYFNCVDSDGKYVYCDADYSDRSYGSDRKIKKIGFSSENKDFRKRIKYTREKEEKILSALVVILVYENFS